MNIKKMNKGLDFLREKYGAAKGEITLKDGHCWVGATPLIPGRMERKIVELKKMTENGTLEGVSTLRFAAFAPKGSDMKAMLAKELDLAAYLGASDVVRVMAVANGSAINVLAKLANDVNVSVEIGAGLPKGEAAYDRHEIIAKRGVACDQTVDTHTPHASIRCWNGNGAVEYTDVDTELFGLTYEEIWNVRAAFALLQKRADAIGLGVELINTPVLGLHPPVEKVAPAFQEVIGAMEQDTGLTIRQLKVDGGACANNFLMQFQSDILDCHVHRPQCIETTALGAAYLAGLAVGYWESLEDIRNNWAIDRVFTPAMDEEKQQKLLKGWHKAVKCAMLWGEDE